MKKLIKKVNTTSLTTFKYNCRCQCGYKFIDNYTDTAMNYNKYNDPPMPL